MTSLQHLADTLDTHKDHLCYIDRKDKLRCQLLERTTLFLASDIGEIYAADLSLTENSTTPWRTTP
jgi:hypothetical protein